MTFYATHDTFIDSGSPNTNFNNEYLLFGDQGGAYKLIPLRFQYAPSSLPVGATITMEQFCVSYLASYGIVGGNSIDFGLWENSCSNPSWNGGSVTYNSFFNTYGCSSGPLRGSGTYYQGQSYRCIDVTGLNWTTVASDGVIIAEFATSNKTIMFYDWSHSATLRPRIRVDYSYCP